MFDYRWLDFIFMFFGLEKKVMVWIMIDGLMFNIVFFFFGFYDWFGDWVNFIGGGVGLLMFE